MRTLAGRFGLGASLAVAILLAGTPGCVFAGWIVAALLMHCLVRKNTSYKDMFINGLISHGLGWSWVWSMVAYFSELNAFYVSLIFAVFLALHALSFPAMLALYRALPQSLDRFALRTALACTTVEWLPLKLFPWRLGQSQWSFTTFIQIADIGGVLLITFVMLWLCEALYRGLREHNRLTLIIAVALPVAVVAYGVIRIHQLTQSAGKEMLVSLVQASSSGDEDEAVNNEGLYAKLQSLTEGIEASPDLVVWPETSLPFVLHESVFEKKNEPRLPTFSRKLNLIIGAKTYRRPNRSFNSAVLIQANDRIPLPYNKRLPIPFGEYIPFEEWLPFLRYVHPSAKNVDHGSETRIFELPLSDARGTARIAPFLCYEEVFPEYGVEAVEKGANVLLGLADDSWSGPAGELPIRQHFVLAAFRSVELRRSFIRGTATGITAVLSPKGQITAALPMGQEGVLSAPVEMQDSRTIYALLGGDMMWQCLGYLLFFVVGLRALSRWLCACSLKGL